MTFDPGRVPLRRLGKTSRKNARRVSHDVDEYDLVKNPRLRVVCGSAGNDTTVLYLGHTEPARIVGRGLFHSVNLYLEGDRLVSPGPTAGGQQTWTFVSFNAALHVRCEGRGRRHSHDIDPVKLRAAIWANAGSRGARVAVQLVELGAEHEPML